MSELGMTYVVNDKTCGSVGSRVDFFSFTQNVTRPIPVASGATRPATSVNRSAPPGK